MTKNNPFFGQVAENYDSWYSAPSAKYAEDVENRLLVEALDGLSGSMLEVGSGTGNYLMKLQSFDFKCGIDSSIDMLSISRKKAAAPVVNGRAEELPFRDGSFDVVVAITALEFFDGLELGLEEMLRVARKHIILAFLSKPSLLHAVRSLRNLFTKNEFTSYNPLNPRRLAKYLVEKSGGLNVELIKSTLLFFPVYHRALRGFFKAFDLNFTNSHFGGYSVIRLIKTEK